MTYDPHCETFRFAWRKISFVLRGFRPVRRPNVSPGASDLNSRGRPAAETVSRISSRGSQGELRFFSGPSPQRWRASERSPNCPSSATAVSCGDDQGVKKLRNSRPASSWRRREPASKDASGAANEAMSWTILRDAKLRFAPQDEAGGWRSRCISCHLRSPKVCAKEQLRSA